MTVRSGAEARELHLVRRPLAQASVPEALLSLLHSGTSTIGKAVVRLLEQP